MKCSNDAASICHDIRDLILRRRQLDLLMKLKTADFGVFKFQFNFNMSFNKPLLILQCRSGRLAKPARL